MTRSVGAGVLARADELSGALLEKERAARASVAYLVEQRAVAASTGAAARAAKVADPSLLATDSRLRSGLAQRMDDTLKATVDVFEALAGDSWELACSSIEDELLVLSPVAGAPDELAGRVVDDVREQGERFIAGRVRDYRRALEGVLGTFRADVIAQVRFSASRDEETPLLLRRLFSTSPVRLEHCAGRGVWPRVLTPVEARLVDVSIVCANTARLSAIDAFGADLEA